MKILKLRSGGEMPIVGYGTWTASGDVLENALNEALKSGYRHIDTAYLYKNECTIGKVLNEWISSGRVTRDDLFVVTKLPAYATRPEDVEKYLKESLQNLGLNYVDMYLIHSPFGLFAKDQTDLDTMVIDYDTDHLAIWKVMEKQVDCGRTKAIGLSNFNAKQVQKLLDYSRIKPDNLQVEHHIYLQQTELVDFCRDNGIVVTAYSTLGTKDGKKRLNLNWSKGVPEILENEVVLRVASKHGKTPAQIVLRFTIQKGVVVIPKSTNSQRLVENIQIFDFELDAQDVEDLERQDVGDKGRLWWFTIFAGVKDHPEYPFPKEI
ncbi:NADP-dependent oxidoreductase domain,Aldo/keto reductase, conserved site,Aldo/keto reductase [Cinara cedri]|uniref:NADP-dependent oxidoreductase domain,Aldo/keto reductase, conserved site,Aldo/keto reductase n=1 Tax=Cinara cedri TaxID=506608 RepID=A0A5E4MA57_9HEMI|nr:NADP-dependent oxidoreductase domain,Aldo/keto reductase, conserved site,Aldo/keto reductase [Cinara cedri]